MSVERNAVQNDLNETRMISETLSFVLTHSSDRFNLFEGESSVFHFSHFELYFIYYN